MDKSKVAEATYNAIEAVFACGKCGAFWDCERAGIATDHLAPTECFTPKVTQERVLEVLLDVWMDNSIVSKVNACFCFGRGLGIPVKDLLIAVAKKEETKP